MEIFLIVLVFAVGFYMLWSMGANDVANAVGTSVGSGAITFKKALLIAAVLEFCGAFLLGANVSETIQSGIIDPHAFRADPRVFVFGMLASLFATAIWVQVATYCRWPVSSTHAIIGAILGFGSIVVGASAVEWGVVGMIAVSWVLSPSISALLAFFFFTFIQRKILYAYSPLIAAKRIAPILVFLVLCTFVIATIANGLKNIQVYLPLYLVVIIGISIGLVGALLCHFFCRRMHQGAQINPHLSANQQQQLYSLNKVHKHLIRAKLASSGKLNQQLGELSGVVGDMLQNVRDTVKWESHLSADYRAVEKIFAGLQILTACFVAFAHGANDVANAVGPMSGILHVIRDPGSLGLHSYIPPWLLAFGGIAIVIGLATYGFRVIETIGRQITQLTPTRGFSAEFAAATTILVASKLGLPISTTHSIVGAVLGVGLARGLSSLNFPLIRDIFLSWFITIPSSALLSILLFYIFKLLFL